MGAPCAPHGNINPCGFLEAEFSPDRPSHLCGWWIAIIHRALAGLGKRKTPRRLSPDGAGRQPSPTSSLQGNERHCPSEEPCKHKAAGPSSHFHSTKGKRRFLLQFLLEDKNSKQHQGLLFWGGISVALSPPALRNWARTLYVTFIFMLLKVMFHNLSGAGEIPVGTLQGIWKGEERRKGKRRQESCSKGRVF